MEFFIENLHPSIELDTEILKTKILNMLDAEGFLIEYLGIICSTRDHIHELNREYLQHDYPTDVLSFALNTDAAQSKSIDGEVYVDLDMALERAPEFQSDFQTEAYRYVLHGTLHLMGYDDASPEQKAEMHRLEDLYLQ